MVSQTLALQSCVHCVGHAYLNAHTKYNILILPYYLVIQNDLCPMVSLTTPSSLRMLMLSLATRIRELTVQVGAAQMKVKRL